MSFVEYPDAKALFQTVANLVADGLKNEIASGGVARLAVPGGSTPGPLFDILANTDLPWEKVVLMLGDERWVSLDSPRSNTGLIKDRLLQNRAAKATYQALFNGMLDAQTGAKALAKEIEAHLPLSVAVVGMGADMHTASIFPNAPERALAQSDDAPALVAMTPGDGLEDRVTLSARALKSAKHIHVIIIGDEKRAAYEMALKSSIDKAPIAQLLPHATVHWAAA